MQIDAVGRKSSHEEGNGEDMRAYYTCLDVGGSYGYGMGLNKREYEQMMSEWGKLNGVITCNGSFQIS